jgi:ATP-dependent Lhr-like helicase
MRWARSTRRSNTRTTILFVNTRSQAEMLFQELWRINDDSLPIALHHGSLDVGQRRRVEAAMAENKLRAVVATSTLDLGIDWGDVDLVVHVGAPKGASRLAQRIGRSNHRMDEPSKAILVPANRFEVMECQAALDANYLGAQDTPPVGSGALDVLCQHIMGMACADPFDALLLYDEIIVPRPMPSQLGDVRTRDGFRRHRRLCAEKLRALCQDPQEQGWSVARLQPAICPAVPAQYRHDHRGAGAQHPAGPARARARSGAAGRCSGRSRNIFSKRWQGDTFLFSGKVLRFEGIRENECLASEARSQDPRIPAYAGGKFPLSTYLADGVRAMLADPEKRAGLPDQVRDWLAIQEEKSVLPKRDELLIETFPRGNRFYMVAYPFEGRLAHQTLGMLLTRRLDRAGAKPLGFVATDYSLAIWGLEDLGAARGEKRRLSVSETVRRGHAGRRSRGMAQRNLSPEAHVPQLRGDRRTDRAAPSRQGEDRPAGHRVG